MSAEQDVTNETPFEIRPFEPDRDLSSIKQIWRECAWIERKEDERYVEDFYSVGQTYVASFSERAECVATTAPGTIRYQTRDLPLAAVTAVLTSHVARKRGLGKAVTARAVAASADTGAAVAALGIFEQGFYNQLGFGNGPYEHFLAFDPADLKPLVEFRVPRRLTLDDWREMATALQHRWLHHGGCVLSPPEVIKAEAGWAERGFGLGYVDDQDRLTHFFFGELSGEHGPLKVSAMAYQNGDQLLELMALLRSLGDQISQVTMAEPAHVQLQDLLQQPFRLRRLSRGGDLEGRHRACSFWQIRMLDLQACLRATRLPSCSLHFNLELRDPIRDALPKDASWAGIAGNYIVKLGEYSDVEPGHEEALPSLRASVNAFTRWWFGIRPATQLTISDDLHGAPELLAELDAALLLPPARWGWDF